MIIDVLANAEMYAKLNSRIELGLNFLKTNNFLTMEPGKYEIDGKNVFALVQTYQTKPKDSGVWEAHRRYIDIQYVAEGIERIGYTNLNTLTVSQPYDTENDFELFKGHGDFLTVNAGTFAIFAPQDAHMPGIAIQEPAQLKKVVVKVLV
jgi:YhcH/YjgK/YiaL family protein